MKTVAELSLEIEIGLDVYGAGQNAAGDNEVLHVYKDEIDSYDRDENGHKTTKTVYLFSGESMGMAMSYASLDKLIAAIPVTSKAVWGINAASVTWELI
jgi:hypothetical protein